MKKNIYQNKRFGLVILALAIAIASFSQAENEEPIKITYRKDYAWTDAHDNLPCMSYYIVYKDKTYADGRTETDRYVCPYGWMAWLSASNAGVHNHTWSSVCNTYSYINDSIEIYYGPEIQDADNAFAHNNSISGNSGNLIDVRHTQTGVPDLSQLRWELRDGKDSFISRDLTDYSSPIFGNENGYLHYDPQNPIDGWYAKDIYGSRYLMLYYGDYRFRELNYSLGWDDRFLYMDGQLFDFSGFKPTLDFDLRVTDLTMPDGSPAKVFTFECKMKYLDHDFYAAVVETVYQLPAK